MKKIFSFLLAAFLMISFAANSQTVENNGVFSHMNIGVKGGAAYSSINTLNDFSFNALNYSGALEIGKDVTPITGFSIEGIATPYFTNGFGLARTDLFGNVKFNLMNLFGGYKGMPRVFETKLAGGLGWNHNFNSSNPNDLGMQFGLEFDFNLGRNRNWYITFSPMVQTNNILESHDIIPVLKKSDLKANVGVAYRLGRGKGSHNFVIPETSVAESDYNDLYAKYNELLTNKPVVDTVVVEKVVEVEKTVNMNEKPIKTFVDFEIGSSELSPVAKRTINEFVNQVKGVKNLKVKVIGSADSKTGSTTFNENIAWARANAVASELVSNGINVVSTEMAIDIENNAEASRCAVIVVE